MSEYKRKTKKELIQLLDEKDDTILDQALSISELSSEIDCDCDELSIENPHVENLILNSFNEGYEAKENNEEKYKAFLNYKVRLRL